MPRQIYCTRNSRSGKGGQSHKTLHRALFSGQVIDRSSLMPLLNSSKLPANVQPNKGPKLQVIRGSVSRYKSSVNPSNLKFVASNVIPPIDCTTNSTVSGTDLLRIAIKAGVASSTDSMLFFMWVRDLGITKAIQKATKFGLQFQQPLQALYAGLNVPGRNYSDKNAKRKRPLGS